MSRAKPAAPECELSTDESDDDDASSFHPSSSPSTPSSSAASQSDWSGTESALTSSPRKTNLPSSPLSDFSQDSITSSSLSSASSSSSSSSPSASVKEETPEPSTPELSDTSTDPSDDETDSLDLMHEDELPDIENNGGESSVAALVDIICRTILPKLNLLVEHVTYQETRDTKAPGILWGGGEDEEDGDGGNMAAGIAPAFGDNFIEQLFDEDLIPVLSDQHITDPKNPMSWLVAFQFMPKEQALKIFRNFLVQWMSSELVRWREQRQNVYLIHHIKRPLALFVKLRDFLVGPRAFGGADAFNAAWQAQTNGNTFMTWLLRANSLECAFLACHAFNPVIDNWDQPFDGENDRLLGDALSEPIDHDWLTISNPRLPNARGLLPLLCCHNLSAQSLVLWRDKRCPDDILMARFIQLHWVIPRQEDKYDCHRQRIRMLVNLFEHCVSPLFALRVSNHTAVIQYSQYLGPITDKTGSMGSYQRFTRAIYQQPVTFHQGVMLELKRPQALAAHLYALVVFVSDGYLTIHEICDPKLRRFLLIATRLPLELQMVLCNNAYRVASDIITANWFELASKHLNYCVSGAVQFISFATSTS